MGKKFNVPQDGIKQLIADAYQMCEPYQWAREALVNSIEAGARSVFFGVEEQGLTAHGVRRRYVADDGHGMTPEQMEVFMSSFGGGGKEVGIDANRGVGMKASTFEWNPYGVVVCSWTTEYPEGAMVWIHRDADGNWEQRGFETENEDGSVDIDYVVEPFEDDELGINFAALKTDAIDKAGHGTVVLFLGDSKERDTDGGDYSRDESPRKIAKYLNTRFLDIPEGITVKVQTVEKSERKAEERIDKRKHDKVWELPSGEKVTLHSRNVIGVRAYTALDDIEHKGVVTFPYRGRMIEIEWFYGKIGKSDTGYRHEAGIFYRYDQVTKYATLSEAYVTHKTYSDYRHYGMQDLRENLVMIVHAPEYDRGDPGKWGLVPQQSRAMLSGIGGVPRFETMAADFGDLFWNEAAILKGIITGKLAGASEVADEDRRSELKRVLSRVADRMRTTRLFVAKDKALGDPGVIEGHGTGEFTEAGKNARGGHHEGAKPRKKRPRKPATTGRGASESREFGEVMEGGGVALVASKMSDGFPTVRWNRDPFLADDGKYAHCAVYFNRHGDPSNDAGLVVMNPDFPMFLSEIKYWTERYSKADPTKVKLLVREAYENEIASKVSHISRMKMQQIAMPDGTLSNLEERVGGVDKFLLTPEALTVAVTGLINVEQIIATKGGARFGKRASSSAVVAA